MEYKILLIGILSVASWCLTIGYSRKNMSAVAAIIETSISNQTGGNGSDMWYSNETTGCCVYCGAPATQVHHKKYAKRNIGREPIEWLVSVCSSCHERSHNM